MKYSFRISPKGHPALGVLCVSAVLTFAAATLCAGGESSLNSRPVLTIHDFVQECEDVRTEIPVSGRQALLKLNQGYQQFIRGNYRQAAQILSASQLVEKTSVGDFALYYLGESLENARDRAGAESSFNQLLREFPNGSLAPRAAQELAERQLERGEFRRAAQLLENYKNGRDPQVLLSLAKACNGLKDFQTAGRLLETIYYEFPLSRDSLQAGKMLAALRQSGRHRSVTDTARIAARLETLIANGRAAGAFSESLQLVVPLREPGRSLALLLKGKASFFVNRFTAAIQTLKKVAEADSNAYSEALLHLALSYRKLGQFDRFVLTCQTLRNLYPEETATEEALFNLANHYLLKERHSEALKVYQFVAERFPKGQFAPQSHWKVIWDAYMQGQYRKAIEGILFHLSQFPETSYRRAALFWLGRSYLQLQENANAYVVFEQLAGGGANDYYGMLAEKELKSIASSGGAPDTAASGSSRRRLQNILPLGHPQAPALMDDYRRWAPNLRRILQLSAADLPQLALYEVGSLENPQVNNLALQLIKAQLYAQLGDRWNSVKTLSRAIPQYPYLDYDQLPRQLWEILYPLDHRRPIQVHGQKHRLDPLLVAAVIRQESLFNAGARSKARAMGLMQIVSPTGAHLARRLQTPFSPAKLYNAEYNVRLGTLHLADLLNRYKGEIQLALAAYNGGEGRVDRWLEELPRDREEFVESIPFTETRDYVKRILTHWAHYRKLYSE